jgi:RNA polymerase sigma factor (sigma-70 family)
MEATDHLFRREAGRLVSALTGIFGVHNLALAEDVVQEAFCRALEVWPFHGVPDNPSAWLMTTAKHCALDVLRRERTARTYAPELGHLLESEWTRASLVEERFSAGAMKDELLRMMFSCCHPGLPEEAQVSLILNILCGFGVDEVANALVSRPAAVEKRIQRAKKLLAGSRRLFDIAVPADFAVRLPAVQRALYLLFNEGYHGAHPESAIRAELCQEAMRLTDALIGYPSAATPVTFALAALMRLHAARLPARTNADGDMQPLDEQNRSLWDAGLIHEGLSYLERSAAGTEMSPYHLEAAIASVHARAPRMKDTDWTAIIRYYDALMGVAPSPVVALNRAIAVAQRDGPERGLEAIDAIDGKERLDRYPFYAAAQGELEYRRGQLRAASDHFRTAQSLARNPAEKNFFQRRIQTCQR